MSERRGQVTPDWLALREPADAAARSTKVAARLAAHLRGVDSIEIHDLGGGSGALGRWLAPRLPGRQQWVIHDRDPALLAMALANPPGPSADGATVTVRVQQTDVTRLEPDALAGAGLITASALLDLLTADELAGMLDPCRRIGCPILLSLSVTGRVALSPSDPLDSRFAAAFNAHQRRATPAGALLGPDAVNVAAAHLRAAGADVWLRPSPWRLDDAHAALSAEWLRGWIAAACEHEPELAGAAAAYQERRLTQLAAGELTVTVDHADLLALS